MRYPEYKYVDLAIGGVENRNNVVEINKVDFLVSRNPYECYTTFFRFSDEFKDYVEKKGSVGGFQGKAFADFFPFDIDVEGKGSRLDDLKEAIRQARWLVAFLIAEFELDKDLLRFYFSGKKGFHILVPSEVFSCEPQANISAIFKRLAIFISEKCELTFDNKIYDLVRLFRYPNTRHKGTNLFKIPLSYNEFSNLEAKDILELAKTPRHVEYVDFEEEDIISDTLYQKYLEIIADLEKPKRYAFSEFKKFQIPPQSKLCYYKIMEGVELGERDDCAIRLATFFKKMGYPSNITLGALLGWNQRNVPPLKDSDIEKKVSQAYNNNYSYGCNDSVLRRYCDSKCFLRKQKEKTIEDIKSVEDLIVEYKKYVKESSENVIHLGLGRIDKKMRGIAPGEVCEIIALPTAGKTALAINILRNVSINQGIPSLFFSLEQPAVQVFERAASMSIELTGREVEMYVKTGKIEPYLERIIADFKNVYICDVDGLSLKDMKDYILMLEEKIDKKVRFVVIDYLGLISGIYGTSYEVITALSRQIKSFAKEMNIAVLFLHHVSIKQKELKDPINLSDARDSSVAVDATDFLLGMWKPGNTEIHIKLLKSRKSGLAQEVFRFIPDKMIIQLLKEEI